MTNSDRYLIKLAESLSSREWGTAYEYAERAESIEAKNTLKDIAVRLYHNEEFVDDNL